MEGPPLICPAHGKCSPLSADGGWEWGDGWWLAEGKGKAVRPAPLLQQPPPGWLTSTQQQQLQQQRHSESCPSDKHVSTRSCTAAAAAPFLSPCCTQSKQATILFVQQSKARRLTHTVLGHAGPGKQETGHWGPSATPDGPSDVAAAAAAPLQREPSLESEGATLPASNINFRYGETGLIVRVCTKSTATPFSTAIQ